MWETFTQFVAMDGDGAFIWTAWGAALVIFALLTIHTYEQSRTTKKTLQQAEKKR